MTGLIIDDEYVRDLGSHYHECSKKLQDAVNDYIGTVERIKNEAVSSGKFHEAINEFLLYAYKLREVMVPLGFNIEFDSGSFVREVDEKDRYLY